MSKKEPREDEAERPKIFKRPRKKIPQFVNILGSDRSGGVRPDIKRLR
ncbi:MAG: hypothetical protein Q7U36_01005 [bacterium]|nr:hypothetical protein [bacterium]